MTALLAEHERRRTEVERELKRQKRCDREGGDRICWPIHAMMGVKHMPVCMYTHTYMHVHAIMSLGCAPFLWEPGITIV